MNRTDERLKAVLREMIEHIDFYEDSVAFMGWDKQASSFASYCLLQGVLDKHDLERLVKDRLKAFGRTCYEQHISSKPLLGRPTIYPDHVMSPHALAYAIAEKEFSEGELRRMTFDHGETVETFMAGKITDLPYRMMEKLLLWPEPKVEKRPPLGICC